jgi:hypothetical protein
VAGIAFSPISRKDAEAMTASLSVPSALGQRWLLLALAIVFIGFSIPYAHKAGDHRSAFVRWQSQVVQIEQGVDIHQRFNYPNPPIMALVLFPLAKLPDAAASVGLSHDAGLTIAALCWYFIKAGLTLLVLRWVFMLVEGAGRPFPAWACALAAVLSLRPIVSDLQHGNINLFVLFLVVAGMVAYVRGRDLLAGIIIGLAIACKVTPALFLPYFAWKRSWKALIGSALGLVLFLWPGVVPALFLGRDYNQRLVTSWYRDMVYPFVVEGKVTSEHHNQSLPGLAARLLTYSPSFSTYVNDQYTPIRYDNLANLDPRVVSWLVKGCMAGFVLLVVWSCRTPASERRSWPQAAEFGIVLLGMLLFSERTWKHHCVTLVVPFAVVCYLLATERRRGLGTFLVSVLAAVSLLMLATSNGGEDGGDLPGRFGKQAQVYGAFVLADLLLLGALVFLLVRRRRQAAVRAADPAWQDGKTLPPAQAGAA